MFKSFEEYRKFMRENEESPNYMVRADMAYGMRGLFSNEDRDSYFYANYLWLDGEPLIHFTEDGMYITADRDKSLFAASVINVYTPKDLYVYPDGETGEWLMHTEIGTMPFMAGMKFTYDGVYTGEQIDEARLRLRRVLAETNQTVYISIVHEDKNATGILRYCRVFVPVKNSEGGLGVLDITPEVEEVTGAAYSLEHGGLVKSPVGIAILLSWGMNRDADSIKYAVLR